MRMHAIAVALVSIVFLQSSWAHEGKDHAKNHGPKHGNTMLLKQVNQAYLITVKPIFVKCCFDCHSSNTHYPWYSKLPGAKQLIESDIKESLEHLDLTSDFPFHGHASPVEDLEAIEKEINEGDMPPLRYWIFHLGTRLNDSEKQVIRKWTQESLRTLKSSK